MARDINDIQRDIERTRRQLASTLDELADRSKPKNLVDGAKGAATEKLQDRNVQMALMRRWRSCSRPRSASSLPLQPSQERHQGAAAPAR